jgi:4-diphosphocytidyl-2-C-methyl-D-erythritol kinase
VKEMTVVIEKAYAKINLGLKILSRRVDGFHDIFSVMQTVDLCDTLTLVEKPKEIDVHCSGIEGVPDGEKNLAYKAAALLKKEYNVKKGVSITIQKCIPVGAGLGGGSSDAAATLRGLNRLWKLKTTDFELLNIASSVGSDVPFLLRKGTAIASRMKLAKPLIYVAVYPGFAVSTEWAYKNRKNDLTSGDKYVNLIVSLKRGLTDKEPPFQDVKNDLEQTVENRYPLIGEIKKKLLSAGAIMASLSGSGSTVYGLFDDPSQARQAAKTLQNSNWSVFVCRSVG